MNSIGNYGFNNFGDYNKKNNNNIKKDCNKNVYKNEEKEKPLLSSNEADSFKPNVMKVGKKTTITVGISSGDTQEPTTLEKIKTFLKKLF